MKRIAEYIATEYTQKLVHEVNRVVTGGRIMKMLEQVAKDARLLLFMDMTVLVVVRLGRVTTVQ